jgi:hypothetical protein
VDVYTISNPNIEINGVPIKSVDCHFIMNKLVLIEIELDLWGRTGVSSSNVEELLVSTFGTPEISYHNLGELSSLFAKKMSWISNNVELTYRYVSSFGSPNTYTLTYSVKDYQKKKDKAKMQYINSHKGDL